MPSYKDGGTQLHELTEVLKARRARMLLGPMDQEPFMPHDTTHEELLLLLFREKCERVLFQ